MAITFIMEVITIINFPYIPNESTGTPFCGELWLSSVVFAFAVLLAIMLWNLKQEEEAEEPEEPEEPVKLIAIVKILRIAENVLSWEGI